MFTILVIHPGSLLRPKRVMAIEHQDKTQRRQYIRPIGQPRMMRSVLLISCKVGMKCGRRVTPYKAEIFRSQGYTPFNWSNCLKGFLSARLWVIPPIAPLKMMPGSGYSVTYVSCGFCNELEFGCLAFSEVATIDGMRTSLIILTRYRRTFILGVIPQREK